MPRSLLPSLPGLWHARQQMLGPAVCGRPRQRRGRRVRCQRRGHTPVSQPGRRRRPWPHRVWLSRGWTQAGLVDANPADSSFPLPGNCRYTKVSVHCRLRDRGGDKVAEPTGLETSRCPPALCPEEQLPLFPEGHLDGSGGVAVPGARGWAAARREPPNLCRRRGRGCSPRDGHTRGGSNSGAQPQGRGL